jgi:hypothetical protein
MGAKLHTALRFRHGPHCGLFSSHDLRQYNRTTLTPQKRTLIFRCLHRIQPALDFLCGLLGVYLDPGCGVLVVVDEAEDKLMELLASSLDMFNGADDGYTR